VRPLSVPFAASIAGHAGLLSGLLLLATQLPPLPLPQPRAVEIAVAVLPPPPIPDPFTVTQPAPEPEPPPVVKAEPPPIPEPEPPPPAAVTAEPPPPPPPPKRVVAHKPPPPPHRPPPRVVREEPPPPIYRAPISSAAPLPLPLPPQPAPMQTAAVPVAVPRPAPAPAGPVVSAGYRAALSAWLEGHKRYPDNARSRGEEGRAVLRFRVDRSGRLLDYAVLQSTGYADLDAAVNDMMRGANLPPFPADMTASDVEVTVTIRFGLTR
jgi:periplasmic protein TonB